MGVRAVPDKETSGEIAPSERAFDVGVAVHFDGFNAEAADVREMPGQYGKHILCDALLLV